MTSVALMVSGHGYGHAVRSAEVARALLKRRTRVLVRTDAPAWLFPPEVEHLASTGEPLDVGAVQHDGLELDIDATRAKWHEFAAAFEERARQEAEVLRQHSADVVLGDIPPLAFAAAARAGIPSAAMTNFGWDWIYAAWPCFSRAIATVQAGYASASVLLRLPLHSAAADAFPAFRRIEDVPLVARTARLPRDATRKQLGIGAGERVVLLSFGAFDANIDLQALAEWQNYMFVLTPPLANLNHRLPPNVRQLLDTQLDYVDLLAACDVVVTKPGYGIVSDCLANRVPVLFTDRGPFREYDILADALRTLGHARYVPRSAVIEGRLGPHLDALQNTPPVWAEMNVSGANVVAERVLALAQVTIKESAFT